MLNTPNTHTIQVPEITQDTGNTMSLHFLKFMKTMSSCILSIRNKKMNKWENESLSKWGRLKLSLKNARSSWRKKKKEDKNKCDHVAIRNKACQYQRAMRQCVSGTERKNCRPRIPHPLENIFKSHEWNKDLSVRKRPAISGEIYFAHRSGCSRLLNMLTINNLMGWVNKKKGPHRSFSKILISWF